MGSTAATFSGTSKYAADLQQAINRAVSIAAIPLNQLNRNVSALQGQSGELSTLQSKFAAIQTAIQSLTSATNGSGLTGSVSDDSVASATVDSSAAVSAGNYTLNVSDAGSPTITLSSASLPIVVDPTATSISTASSFTVTFNGLTFVAAPTSNSLNALAQAINTSGAPVSATIINIGPPSAPDYRLSLQSQTLGNASIQLNDGTKDLLSTLTTGSPAQYTVNGLPSPTPISTDSSTVTIAPGVTVHLLHTGTTTVSVAPDSSAGVNALSSFVAAYNAAATELAQNHGSSGGDLTGSSIVFQLEQSLRSLTSYTGGSGAVQHLAELGITFNSSSGQLSFDQAQYNSVAAAHPSDVAAFLGSASGGGFLTTATNILNGLEDPTNGTLQQGINSVESQITSDNQQISDTRNRIIKINNDLVAQMSAADAAIAALDSQVTFFTMLFADTQNALKNG